MGFFSMLFSNKKENKENKEYSSKPEITEEQFVDYSEPNGKTEEPQQNYQVSYGTGFPIDIVYGFINKDFEQKGFDDAMTSSESSYKESGMNLIVNELRQLFEQVKLKYKGDIRDMNVLQHNLEMQGLPTQAAQVKMRLDTFAEHMSKIEGMEEALDNKEERVMRMVSTYERGFLKGLAAKTDVILKNNGTVQ